MDVATRLVVLLALVFVGLAARRVGVLDRARTGRLNALAFYVALPALVFVSTYDRRPGELASPPLVLGLWTTFAVMIALAWVVHRREPSTARRSVAVAQSYHCNLGYVGLPIVSVGLGSAAAGRASVILGVGALTQIPLTIALLVRMNGADTTVGRQLRTLAANPIIVTLVLGFTVATVDVQPPRSLLAVLDPVSIAALPVALLGVGASLEGASEDAPLPRVSSVLSLKLLAMPAIAWVAFSALGADPVALAAGVVMMGAPAAVSSYILADELGGDAGLASTNVFATTLVGLVTLSVLVVLLG